MNKQSDQNVPIGNPKADDPGKDAQPGAANPTLNKTQGQPDSKPQAQDPSLGSQSKTAGSNPSTQSPAKGAVSPPPAK